MRVIVHPQACWEKRIRFMKIRNKARKNWGLTLVELLPPVGLIGLLLPFLFGDRFLPMEEPVDPVVAVEQNGSAPWEPTVQGMKEARSWLLSPEENVLVGRWKESDSELPNAPPFEAMASLSFLYGLTNLSESLAVLVNISPSSFGPSITSKLAAIAFACSSENSGPPCSAKFL